MPNTTIPPFQAQGSSNPAERSLNPPLWQQILEGLMAGGIGFAGGFRGGQGGGSPLLGYELAKQIQGERMGNVQNQILGQILQGGMQLQNTPENVPQQAPGYMPTMTQGQNPAYQQLIDKILQGSEQFSRLGGDPNQLVNVLTKTGVMRDPILDRQLKIEERRDIRAEKERDLKRELSGLKYDTEQDRAKTYAKWVNRVAGNELTQKDLANMELDARRIAIQQAKYEEGIGNEPPDIETLVGQILGDIRQRAGLKAQAAPSPATSSKLKPLTPAQIAAIKKMGGKKYLTPQVREAIKSQGSDPDSYKE